MSDNSTERSGRRRRGGRRRSNHKGDRVQSESTTPAAAKPTLWQKIVAFFTGKKSNGSSPATTQRPARQYPTYEPRSKSERTEKSESYTPTESRTDRPERSDRPEPRPSRKPEAVDVTTPKLYVGNLSFDAAESDLLNLFNGVGSVQTAEIVSHKDSEKSKGFGFVTMTSVDEAKRAVTELHDKDFMGRKLVVSGAKTPPGR
jgi:RNA recognition motif-containing protein